MKYGFLEDVSDIDFTLPVESKTNAQFISEKSGETPKIYIGCSVWSDKDFVGNYYPQKTPQKNYLVEYAKQFSTVEVNATRYGVPQPKTMENWKNAVPEGFKLSFKLPQIISQRKDLLSADVLGRLDQFILAKEKMGSKAGTTFMLMQNNFSMDRLPELEKFLQHLPQEQAYAVEIRNPELNQKEELGQLLNTYNITHVITDTAGRRDVVHQMITNNTLYVRFVGNGLVPTDYARADAWIKQIKSYISKGVNQVYFLIHQPNQNRSMGGDLVSYVIAKINKDLKMDLKVPVNYKDSGQQSIF